jgi:hypothetical protein
MSTERRGNDEECRECQQPEKDVTFHMFSLAG